MHQFALDKARHPHYNAASSGGKPSSPVRHQAVFMVELDENSSVAIQKAASKAFQKQDDNVIIFASRL